MRRSPVGLAELDLAAVWHADVIVLGSGVAGLSAALSAAPRSTLLLTKTRFGGGSTPWAQGGIAAAWDRDDRPELHASDTLDAGRGLCDRQAVAELSREASAAIRRLMGWGVTFDLDQEGRIALGREGGHGKRRILHAGGDATGRVISEALVREVGRSPSVRVEEEVFAVDLLLWNGRVVGVLGSRDGKWVAALGSAVVLATGGLGQIYLRTTNPREVTGDGLAMAARAGARLADLEMVQFHPTALAVPGADEREPMPLLTEALRGEGALLTDRNGHRFLPALDSRAELAPRDVVARACWLQDQRGGCFLDLRSLAAILPVRFPTVARLCADAGLDPAREPVPVSPAAHYHMGGVLVDLQGATSLEGLWACGEVAASGVHGANRLASNSLLEGVVFGSRAGAAAAQAPPLEPGPGRGPVLPWGGRRLEPGVDVSAAADEAVGRLRRLAWSGIGLQRSAASLDDSLAALTALAPATDTCGGEARNLRLVAELVARAAREREESRGAHFRSDASEALPSWRRRLVLCPTPRLTEPGRATWAWRSVERPAATVVA